MNERSSAPSSCCCDVHFRRLFVFLFAFEQACVCFQLKIYNVRTSGATNEFVVFTDLEYEVTDIYNKKKQRSTTRDEPQAGFGFCHIAHNPFYCVSRVMDCLGTMVCSGYNQGCYVHERGKQCEVGTLWYRLLMHASVINCT